MTYEFDFSALVDFWPALLQGALTTLQMTVIAVAGGLAIGVLCAIARRGSNAPLRLLAGAYIELVRNTPYLIQIFFLFFGLSRRPSFLS